jgi:SAM-dependent methyltransferase
MSTPQDLDYGNWVSNRLLCVCVLMGALLVGLSLVHPAFIIGAAFFLLSFAYFLYARYKFSPRGGNVQTRLHDLVLDHLDWDGDGKALDIGCGNAPLAIKLAQKYPEAQVTGIDCWGAEWDYSQEACQRNAQAAGVADRAIFQKASAAALPFDDGLFDAAVSKFVFHEVRDAPDKQDVIREALRVVRKGGKFAFQDLFLVRRLYGQVDELVEAIQSWDVEDVHFVDTSDADFVSKPLKLPFMVGSTGIIYGTK